MIPRRLIEIVNQNNIIYTVVANMENDEVESIGEISELEYSSIAKNLFGDKQSIENLFISLKGQMLPRTWRQGRVSAVVCNPNKDIVVGLFYHENADDPIAKYRYAKNLNMMIEDIWRN
ncbi:hypothetical protein V7150_16520 [Neobacillus drentensis]|uniref:hypothetical protein n=1 Tax=Neobacillus drentensis TaxID=220684 RepID=UPI0030003587